MWEKTAKERKHKAKRKIHSLIRIDETMRRKEWFDRALVEVKKLFASHGYMVPDVEVSFGFTSKGLRSSTVGECWSRNASTSKVNHIFISPANTDSLKILSTLIHECIHAIDDCQHGHGKEFKEIALKIGFKVPMRSTPAGEKPKAQMVEIVNRIGEFTAPRITAVHQPRLHKPPARARCAKCGYTVSMLKQFLILGPPVCPVHGVIMEKIGCWTEERT